jgi:hypothetical protein
MKLLFYFNHGLRNGLEIPISFLSNVKLKACFASLFTVSEVSCSSATRNCLSFLVKGCLFTDFVVLKDFFNFIQGCW